MFVFEIQPTTPKFSQGAPKTSLPSETDRFKPIQVHKNPKYSPLATSYIIFKDFCVFSRTSSDIFLILPDQVPSGPQTKSFRGGQGVHILLDRYRRDMAT